MPPVKMNIAVMFVDEGVIYKTAEAALWLNSYRMRQQQDGDGGRTTETKTDKEAERRSDMKTDRLKVIKGWGMTSVGNIAGT